MKIGSFIVFILVALMIHSCYYDKFEEIHPTFPGVKVACDTSQPVTYANNIAPYFVTYCGTTQSSCHVGGTLYPMNKLPAVKTLGQNGKLMGSINWVFGGQDNMPQGTGSKIPACDIVMIQRWINAGYP